MFNDTIANVIMALMIISCCGALLCWQFTLSRVFKNAAEAGYFPKVFARVNSKDAPVRGVFILLAIETILTLFTANDSLRDQFETLVNLAVVTKCSALYSLHSCSTNYDAHVWIGKTSY